MKLTALSDLVGQDEPVDPSQIQFRAVPALVWAPRKDEHPDRACRGCLFKGQKSKVCVQAGQVARLASMPDCEERDTETDKTFIYIAIPVDERQLTVFDC